MNNKFGNYIISWFHQYIEDHEENEDLLMSLFNTVCPRKDEDSLSDWLKDDETVCDWLLKCHAEDIYSSLFVKGGYVGFEDMPDMETFVGQILKEASNELGLSKYEFVEEFVEDMASSIIDYDNPWCFFDDISHGGCVSGMVVMLIYNHDCLDIYKKYANDMEEFRENLEEEMGVFLHSDRSIYRYVWICWLCYEELAYQIGRYLFENNF